jgi:hypothetical protein
MVDALGYIYAYADEALFALITRRIFSLLKLGGELTEK